MDEGVDPTDMCQTLVAKVAQSEQLRAVADSDILVLFEDWLDELERELLERFAANPDADPVAVARQVGLSENGARFMITKLRHAGKL